MPRPGQAVSGLQAVNTGIYGLVYPSSPVRTEEVLDERPVQGRWVGKRGDENIHYFNGLDMFNLDEIAAYTQDQCHPNGDGIELQGEHFLERILPGFRR